MKVLNNYILILVIKYILIAASIIVGLDILFNTVFNNKDLVSIHETKEIVLYFFSLTLDTIYLYSPIYIYIGLLICLAKLSANSELLVIKATGITFWHLVYLLFRPVFIIVIILMFISEFAIPYTDSLSSTNLYNATFKKNILYKNNNSAIYISTATHEGHLNNFIEYQFNDDKLYKTTFAKTGNYLNNNWVLKNLDNTYYYSDRLILQEDELSLWDSSLSVRSLFVMSANIQALSLDDLYYYILNNSKLSFYSKNYEVIFWNKIFLPIILLCMVILALSCVYNLKLRQSIYKQVSVSVAIGILLQYIQLIVVPISIIYALPTIFTPVIPIILILMVARWMIYKMS